MNAKALNWNISEKNHPTMTKQTTFLALLMMFTCFIICRGQNKIELGKINIKPETKGATTIPNSISRNIEQDRHGNLWIAAFDGVFRYDGKSFTNVTTHVSSARFFSVLEDSRGNLWFGSIGSGVYRYDGQSFRNFTTKDGLPNNEIGCIYEDKAGNLWFGANGGASRYDGKSFRNYMLHKGSMIEDRIGQTFPDFTRPPMEVTSIIEDKAGKYWFATRGNTLVYDGKTFSIVSHDGVPFTNVRTLLEDKEGNVWLGGNDGLWRYDGSLFTNFTQDFVGYIYEDKKGNIWTSSQNANENNWVLSRYERSSFFNIKPTVVKTEPKVGMLFGILEATDESIWFGGVGGVYRYDGSKMEDFKEKK